MSTDHDIASRSTTPLHLRFAELAKRHPDKLVASTSSDELTWGDLDFRSAQLANHLCSRGLQLGQPVAVCVTPTIDVLVAILAVLRAGGVYMPMDPGHPPILMQQMLSEARPSLLLSNSGVADLPALSLLERFDLDNPTAWAHIADLPKAPPALKIGMHDSAYLIFTSGTTGKPKGVVATHANLLHYLDSAQSRYRWRSTDIFCSIARFTFSISLFDLLSPLSTGAQVHLLSRQEVLSMQTFCNELRKVTVVHAGPSLLGSLLRYLQANPQIPAFKNIRHASSGGDLVPPSIMRGMQQLFPAAECYVIYGCTEISCMGTTYEIRPNDSANCNLVGKPFGNVVARILDEHHCDVPVGELGEICFSGAGIAKEYLNRPELNQEKFFEHEGQRFYHTGDLGRLHADGNVEIIGRNDFQIQLRGMRVEPVGIENLTRSLNLAHDCVVVLKTLSSGDARLVAYVVGSQLSGMQIRQQLAVHLPDYMVPQHIVILDALPVTANGKIDRQALFSMPLQPVSGVSTDDVLSEEQQVVCSVVARLLGVEQVGLDDDFYALGGHSLLAVLTLLELESTLGRKLPPDTLFRASTVRGIAQLIDEKDRCETHPVLLNEDINGSNLYMLGGVHVYRKLARHLDGRVTAYGVYGDNEVSMYGAESRSEEFTVQKLAKSYIEIIRRQSPHGPYSLLGFSFSGIVAFEVAQQLIADGDHVESLILIDAVLPEWKLGWRYRLDQLRRALSVPPSVLFAFCARYVRQKMNHYRGQQSFSGELIYGTNPHVRPQDKALLEPLDAVRVATNAGAAARYLRDDIQSYAGHVALIMSGERLRIDPLKSETGGWSRYLRQYQLCNVDTEHLRMLEDEPYVTQIANFVASVTKHGSD